MYCLPVPNQKSWLTNGKDSVISWIFFYPHCIRSVIKVFANTVFTKNLILMLEIKLMCVKCLLFLEQIYLLATGKENQEEEVLFWFPKSKERAKGKTKYVSRFCGLPSPLALGLAVMHYVEAKAGKISWAPDGSGFGSFIWNYTETHRRSIISICKC